jgi:shikimate dehydrogenase
MIQKLEHPTFYFIGVDTGKSEIMKLFPLWIKELGLPDIRMRGYDIRPHGLPEKYRAIVRHIKEDPNALGALVTTHKIDIIRAAGDLFDYFDEYAKLFGEVSSISKKEGKLRGIAKDPITVGLALDAFLPKNYWINNKKTHVFIMGAGGSGIALSSYLMREDHGKNIPSKIIISNRSRSGLEHCMYVHKKLPAVTTLEYIQAGIDKTNDEVVEDLPNGSLVVNATGMGKDVPGSPIHDETVIPKGSFVWDFNKRGSLEFLQQAHHQQYDRKLTVIDGWTYFIHGWSQVMAEVLTIDISPPVVEKLTAIAKSFQ